MLKVTAELGYYSELLGILRDQVGNVSSETEGVALDILTRLNEIDRNIQDMIAFLSQAGSSDTMTDLMDWTEACMAQNVQLLDEFRKSCDQAGAEVRSGYRGSMPLIEAMFPHVPKLEMFARGRRAGWDTWGAEARLGKGLIAQFRRPLFERTITRFPSQMAAQPLDYATKLRREIQAETRRFAVVVVLSALACVGSGVGIAYLLWGV